MHDSKVQLTAILAASFVALVAILAGTDALTDKQMQTLVIIGPALIYAMTLPSKSCRFSRQKDAA